MELLQVDRNRLQDIYKSYNITEEEIERNVEILKEWLKKQAHLPQELPFDGFLEQMLKNNKYRIERTKERIDNYFTLKTLNLEIFNVLASEESLFPLQKTVAFGISPIFLENNVNVQFAYVTSSDPESFDFNKYIQTLVALHEIYLRYNYCASCLYIINAKNFSLGHFKQIDFVKYRNLLKLILDGYGFRIAGIHILNLPIYCNPIIALVKSMSSAKIVSRIKIHDGLESLHKEVPKYVLPKDLDGTATYTLQDLTDNMNSLIENQRKFLADSINYVSNEKFRIGKSKYSDDMFGVDGTFKQMNLD